MYVCIYVMYVSPLKEAHTYTCSLCIVPIVVGVVSWSQGDQMDG